MPHGEEVEGGLGNADVGLDAEEDDFERELTGRGGRVGLAEDAGCYFGDDLQQ
jgi:hypothetical protein